MFKVSTASFNTVAPFCTFSRSEKSFTALSIGPCGRLSQMNWSASLSSATVFSFVLSLRYCLSKRHYDVINSNLITCFQKLNSIFSLNIFNAQKSVGRYARYVLKNYNCIVFQQNHILFNI